MTKPNRKPITQASGDEFMQALYMWLVNRSHGGNPQLFLSPTEDTLRDMVNDEGFLVGEYTVQIVDCLFNKPWRSWSNVTQFVFVCVDTGEYFTIRYLHAEGFVSEDAFDQWGISQATPMATRSLRKQQTSMTHFAMIGDEGRLGIDMHGSFVWMNDNRFRSSSGKVHFPNQWGVLALGDEVESRLEKARTRAKIIALVQRADAEGINALLQKLDFLSIKNNNIEIAGLDPVYFGETMEEV